jgi:hypothetical protein
MANVLRGLVVLFIDLFLPQEAEVIWMRPFLNLGSFIRSVSLTSSTPYSIYLNGSDGKGYFPPPINVGVEYSQNVLELLRDH